MAGRMRKLTTAACGLLLSLAASAATAEVVVVVSANNPVESLSRAQLTDIYLGRLNRFPNGDPVVPIDQRERSPTHDEFYSQYLGQSPAQIKAHWSKLIFTGRGQPPRAVPDDEAAAELVAENPNAIAYVDAGAVNERLRVIAIE
jgi:ABC-type phosphate transport system substrate-binding protein